MRAVVDEVVNRLDLRRQLRSGVRAARTGSRSTTSAASALRVSRPLPAEPYAANRVTGAFILVDEGTNETVGAGMVA